MAWNGPEFVVAIIAVSVIGWLVNNWIRARHGYALEDEWGGKTTLPEPAAVADLRAENDRLAARLGDYEERMRVLEAIVTDKGFTLASQIEGLRDTSRMTGSPN